jgi:hypothetical protein
VFLDKFILDSKEFDVSGLKLSLLTLPILALAIAGCAKQDPNAADDAASSSLPPVQKGDYLLDSEPPKAADVIAARSDAQDDEEVVVVGRIGGSETPWIEGRAAFSIVDPSLKACSDIEGDGCPTPWDYCCETDKLPKATALVKVVDGQGKLVAADARDLLGVKELQTVVVRGKAQRDESGNLTILADGVYVKN